MAVIRDRHLSLDERCGERCWELARHVLLDVEKDKAWEMDAGLLAMRFLAVAEAYLAEIEDRYPLPTGICS